MFVFLPFIFKKGLVCFVAAPSWSMFEIADWHLLVEKLLPESVQIEAEKTIKEGMGLPEATMSMDDFAAAMTETYGDGYAEAYDAADEKEAYRQSLRSRSDSSFAKYVVYI